MNCRHPEFISGAVAGMISMDLLAKEAEQQPLPDKACKLCSFLASPSP